MICDPIGFEPDNNDKHIDYNILVDTPYYLSHYPSPTPSTPLSSPSSSLILDEMTAHQHQQSLSSTSAASVNSMAPVDPQQQPFQYVLGGSNDWLLEPFYDVGPFSYQPLAISPAESNQLMNVAAQSLNCPQFQQTMMMNECAEMPIGGLVSPPLSTRTTGENSGTNDTFDIINQHIHFSDNHQHLHQSQHYRHHDKHNKDNIKLETSLQLLTASPTSTSPQGKPTKNSHNNPSISARHLNIAYPKHSLDLQIHHIHLHNQSPIIHHQPQMNQQQ
ncbi:hypothetical protein BCR42DRAFT_169592 [Absidia repens]|uniref:Uncharacterized protein n=1 Tax=Absidia repens TaxID=90262 RepID=A0A1X2IUM9_9FUNG|nr:hypothetical protein BCR42DRAFT_169592 [Absidia repens]